MRTYAIGDIHGMCDLLREALAWIAQDAGNEPCRVVFLGDYVDRGPSSRQVVETLMRGAERQEWVCLKGNHDDFMARALAGNESARELWMVNGGPATLRSYGDDERTLHAHAKWLSERPHRFEDEHRHYVHGGFSPRRPIAEQDPDTWLWIKMERFEDDPIFDKKVIHGHVANERPEVTRGCINLDTGACFWGRLTVARWLADERVPHFEFFDTAARRAEAA